MHPPIAKSLSPVPGAFGASAQPCAHALHRSWPGSLAKGTRHQTASTGRPQPPSRLRQPGGGATSCARALCMCPASWPSRCCWRRTSRCARSTCGREWLCGWGRGGGAAEWLCGWLRGGGGESGAGPRPLGIRCWLLPQWQP